MTPEYDVKRTDETGPQPVLRPFNDLGTLAPVPAHEPKPLLPPAWAALFATLAGVAGFAAGVAPANVAWAVAALACILALAGGVFGFKVPDFAQGKPVVSAALVGPLGTLAAALVTQTESMPEGYLKSGLVLVAVICAGLAGKALPGPTR